ncbi:MAG: chemotaxis protein CheW [Spirochaetales bacterium]|nr:chemotaxis protein CheW [Spirochaetales bacterium]
MAEKRIDEIITGLEKKSEKKSKDVNIVKDFLIVEIGSTRLAIQIEYLREVFDLQDVRDIAVIPFTPDYVMGIINVRSEIIPVLYLSKILEKQASEKDYRKMIIIEQNEVKIGFPVLRIMDLVSIEVKSIKPIQDVKKKADHAFIAEELTVNEANYGVLDIARLFASRYVQ